MSNQQNIAQLAENLAGRKDEIKNLKVVTGFDGFVDEMISVVDERKSLKDFDPVQSIADFGSIIQGSAGRSSLREIVVHTKDPGGCSVNLSDGLIALGVSLDNYATLGDPINPTFSDFAQACQKCVTWGNEPGRTLAFEFNDGKLMFSAVAQLGDFNPENLKGYLSDGAYLESCKQAKLIALTNWTLYPHMTACWKMLKEEVYQKLDHQPHFFFDLVDPSSRSDDDVKEMLHTLASFEEVGHTTLGINVSEANVISRLFGMEATDHEQESLLKKAIEIREKLGISQVVLHYAKFSAIASKEGCWGLESPYCEKPKKSTGAGDRFNSGFVTSTILGYGAEERLIMANATAGYFIRNAKSASVDDLVAFLSDWAAGKL